MTGDTSPAVGEGAPVREPPPSARYMDGFVAGTRAAFKEAWLNGCQEGFRRGPQAWLPGRLSGRRGRNRCFCRSTSSWRVTRG